MPTIPDELLHISPKDPAAGLSEVSFTAEQIVDQVCKLGQQITQDYQGKRPLLVGVLNGCVPFMADLMRQIDLPLEIDFMAVSSYGDGSKSSGVVRMIKDLSTSMTDRDVILVEDIVDTGLTLNYLLENFKTRQPRSLEVCALLVKPQAKSESSQQAGKSTTNVRRTIKYVGFDCPDAFIVGYGLDYAGAYRNLPMIGVLKPELYQK